MTGQGNGGVGSIAAWIATTLLVQEFSEVLEILSTCILQTMSVDQRDR